jgi:hypothetical protein
LNYEKSHRFEYIFIFLKNGFNYFVLDPYHFSAFSHGYFPTNSQKHFFRSGIEAAFNQNDEALKTQLIFISPNNLLGQGAMLGSAILAPIAAGATISSLGFQAGGIASGSLAAGFMGTYGGSV